MVSVQRTTNRHGKLQLLSYFSNSSRLLVHFWGVGISQVQTRLLLQHFLGRNKIEAPDQEKQMETTPLSRVPFLKEKHGVSPRLWFVESKRSNIFLGLFPSMNGGAWNILSSDLNQFLDNSLHKSQICINLL